MKKTMRRNKKSRKINYEAIPRPIALSPPKYTSQIVRSWHVRNVVSGAAIVAQVISSSAMAANLGLLATSATTSAFLCDQFRLKRICVWGPVATAGTPVTVMLKFVDDPASNTQSGPPKTETDTSISFDRPAYCCLTPPKTPNSIFSQWQDSSLNTAWISISAPVGSIVDFFYQFIIDDLGNTTSGPTIAAATLGNIYHKSIILGGATIGVVTPLNGI